MTVGDLAKALAEDGTAPRAATRRAIRERLDKLEQAFGLVYESLTSVSEMLEDAREMLDADGDDVAGDGHVQAVRDDAGDVEASLS